MKYRVADIRDDELRLCVHSRTHGSPTDIFGHVGVVIWAEGECVTS